MDNIPFANIIVKMTNRKKPGTTIIKNKTVLYEL